MKKVLLTSICRPIGERYGDGPSVGYELLHGQVTRSQGMFSPRANHLQYGLEYIAENLLTPAVVLHYPSKSELVRELRNGYDYVGVAFVLPTFHRMKETVALVRKHSPQAKVVLGGYGTVLADDVLKPYADHVCREEGVGFMRRLLGEPELPISEYKHPLVTSRMSIFSVPVTNTGLIFGGLGCPHGCDFCCTSHFPTGRDVYAVMERHLDHDPDMAFVILDEDFLINKARAMEFRDCVIGSGRAISLFVFGSVKALSQYKTSELAEMGIDGVWIGYEGTRSGYAKREGRPPEELFKDLRDHGIMVLASMILGLDYQTPDIIREEFDGLMRLKPSLTQFAIYGPLAGTPLYDRVMKEGRLRDEYKDDVDGYCRHSAGFTCMIKHPTMSYEEIEGLQRWCFDQFFQRLGPSIYRVVDTWLSGYRTLRDSPNPILRSKAERFAQDLRKSYPIFLPGRVFGPNARVKAWIADLEKQVYDELGEPTFKEKAMALASLGMAAYTGAALVLDLAQHP
ncbi:MAG: cobalamin B12-binding domain-containing protein, partial [Elusimicrobia bacterium]|nr:cobalamin B12-binding domain-containing protein [Elusimicrobiota bacterium]